MWTGASGDYRWVEGWCGQVPLVLTGASAPPHSTCTWSTGPWDQGSVAAYTLLSISVFMQSIVCAVKSAMYRMYIGLVNVLNESAARYKECGVCKADGAAQARLCCWKHGTVQPRDRHCEYSVCVCMCVRERSV